MNMNTQQSVKPSLFALLFSNQKSTVQKGTAADMDSAEPSTFASVFSAFFGKQKTQDGPVSGADPKRTKALLAAEHTEKDLRQGNVDKPGKMNPGHAAVVCIPVDMADQPGPNFKFCGSVVHMDEQGPVNKNNTGGPNKSAPHDKQPAQGKKPVLLAAAPEPGNSPALNRQRVIPGVQEKLQNAGQAGNSKTHSPAVTKEIPATRINTAAGVIAGTESVQKDKTNVLQSKQHPPEGFYTALKKQSPETSEHHQVLMQKNQSGSFSKEALLSGPGREPAGLDKTSAGSSLKPGVPEAKIEPAMQQSGSDLDSGLSMGKPMVPAGTAFSGTEASDLKTISVDRSFNAELSATLVEMKKGDEPKLTVLLNPPSLGRIEIELIQKEDGVEARLFVENQDVKDLIEASLSDIKDAISRQGVVMRDVSIEMNLDQPGGRENQSDMFKNRSSQRQHQQGRGGAHADEKFDDPSEGRRRERYFGYNSMEITV